MLAEKKNLQSHHIVDIKNKFLIHFLTLNNIPAGIYLFNIATKTLDQSVNTVDVTIKTLEWCNSDAGLVFQLLTLNIFEELFLTFVLLSLNIKLLDEIKQTPGKCNILRSIFFYTVKTKLPTINCSKLHMKIGSTDISDIWLEWYQWNSSCLLLRISKKIQKHLYPRARFGNCFLLY